MTKYNNKPCTVDGYSFDSIAEKNRYLELYLMQRSGDISALVVHPKYVLQKEFQYRGETVRKIMYEADFCYIEDDVMVIEDVKGGRATQTAEFKIKAKMLKRVIADQNIEFRIVER